MYNTHSERRFPFELANSEEGGLAEKVLGVVDLPPAFGGCSGLSVLTQNIGQLPRNRWR